MTFIRLTFLVCLLCFTARQLVETLRVFEKPKVAWAESDNDEDESEHKKKLSDNFYCVQKAIESQPIIDVTDKKVRTLHLTYYNEFYGCLTTPPPDFN